MILDARDVLRRFSRETWDGFYGYVKRAHDAHILDLLGVDPRNGLEEYGSISFSTILGGSTTITARIKCACISTEHVTVSSIDLMRFLGIDSTGEILEADDQEHYVPLPVG